MILFLCQTKQQLSREEVEQLLPESAPHIPPQLQRKKKRKITPDNNNFVAASLQQVVQQISDPLANGGIMVSGWCNKKTYGSKE